MIEPGRVCIKKFGRDAGERCVVINVLDNRFVEIVSSIRKKARKANILHLTPLDQKVNPSSEEEIKKKEPSKDALTIIFNELYTLATKDQLTGVLNRRSFEEALGKEVIRAIRENKPLAAIMIDIDNFKHYNDTYGHLQGDEALRKVTRIVSKNTRGDDFVARYGGEEFIVILPGASIKEAEHIAERMRSEVEKMEIKPTRKDLPHGYNKITMSLGISELGDDGVQGMLDRADKALY